MRIADLVRHESSGMTEDGQGGETPLCEHIVILHASFANAL